MFSFVDDGHERAIDGIRAVVEAKYAKQMKSASAAEQRKLRKKIKAEIEQAAKRQASPSALY